MKSLNLKNLSFDDLVSLRESVESMISKRVAAEKRSLEDRLSRLTSFTGGVVKKLTGQSSLKGRKAEPKYRNPGDASQTWAGRGMKPRWLQALIDQGHRLEDFAISLASPARAKSTRKTAKKAARGSKKTAAGRKASARKTSTRKSSTRKSSTSKSAVKKTRRTRKAA